jgi:outer membrane lipoprotein-sorting protein
LQKHPNGPHYRSFVMCAALFSAALLPVFAMPCRASEAPSDTDVDAFLARLSDAAARVQDYACTFGKQERVDGQLQPASTIVLKQRRDPRCIYMKWTAGPERGREAIHCPVKYGNDLEVHEGSGIASWMTLTLDPNGSTAMDGERHPITEAGIFFPVEQFVARVRADRTHLRFERSETPDCLTVTQATPTGFYAHRTEVCLEPEHSLPASLTVWDAGGALLERYTFSDYRIDVGVTDRDFDVANPDYPF